MSKLSDSIIEQMNEFTAEYDDEICANHDFITLNSHIHTKKYWDIKNKMILLQRLHNIAMEKEIAMLAKNAHDRGIKLIFMKGLALAKELYPHPETKISSDLDVLVAPTQLYEILQLCRYLGYQSDVFGDLYKAVEKHFAGTEPHFQPIKKESVVSGIPFQIILEIHTQVYAQTLHQIDINRDLVTQSALERAVPFNFTEQILVYTYHPVDYLLFLMMHMVKHIFHETLGVLAYGHSPSYQSFTQLTEIAMYYHKHQKEMEMEKIVCRAVEWGMLSELYFSIKIIQQIYPDFFNYWDLEESYSNYSRKTGFFALAIQSIQNVAWKEILFMSSHDLAIYMYLSATNSYGAYLFCGKEHYLNDKSIIFDSEHQRYNEKTYSKYIQGRYLMPMELTCTVMTKWDDIFLYIQYTMENDKLVYYNNKDPSPDFCDSFELHLYRYNRTNNQPFLFMLKVVPMQTDPPSVRIYDINHNEQLWETSNYISSLKIMKNGYILKIGIKWDIIGLKPEASQKIPFNIIMNNYDASTQEIARLSWVEEIRYLVDTFSMGCIILQ